MGNLRVTFREGETNSYLATMEDSNLATERTQFANIDITQAPKPGPNQTGKAARLNATENKPLGPWKSLPVGKGDQVQAQVKSYYEQAPSPGNSFSLVPFLTTAGTYGETTVNGETISSPFNPSQLLFGLTVIPNNPNGSSTIPNAYLRLVEYNAENQKIHEEIRHITIYSLNSWENLLEISYLAKGNGRVEIFVANESDKSVWFDELSITHEQHLIAQETHYDPWGLELAGIGKAGLNRFTFNAQSEKQKDLNGGKGYFYETDFRGYDPQLGRFHGYDLLASAFSGITPYQFGFNNPVSFNDPTGLASSDTTKSGGQSTLPTPSSDDKVYNSNQPTTQVEGIQVDKAANDAANANPVEAKREDNPVINAIYDGHKSFIRRSAPIAVIVFAPIILTEVGVIEISSLMLKSRFIGASLDAGGQFAVNYMTSGNLLSSFQNINITSVTLSTLNPTAGFSSVFRNNILASAYDIKINYIKSSTLFGNGKSIMDVGFAGVISVSTKGLFEIGIPGFLRGFANHQDGLVNSFQSRLSSGLFNESGTILMNQAINKTQKIAINSRLWANRSSGLVGGFSQGLVNNFGGALLNFSSGDGSLLNFSNKTP